MINRYANVPAKGNGARKPKIFVLDTNIVLHDYKAIRKFQDNDIVIPIAVLEELDKFDRIVKSGELVEAVEKVVPLK